MRWGLPLVVAVAAAALLVVPAARSLQRAGEPPPRITEAVDASAAFLAARRQREPVAVTSLTTPTRAVSARPDGSLTAELTTRPVRLLRAGKWVPVDPALAARPDGTVGPRAVEAELAFSSGGKGRPLVRFGAPGRSFALTWPGALPAPVLAGSSATYPEVLPGVDLVLRAEADGFTQHLVVKSATAARNPALVKVRLGLTTDGLRVRSTGPGALEARDAADQVVFSAPPSTMWDATGYRQAPVGIELGAGALTLLPDRKLLADPATRYPVTVDPAWATPGRTGWAKVFSGKPDTTAWNGGVDGAEGKSGLCYPSSACNGIGAVRTYFQYDTGFLAGKRIMSAVLNTTITHSPSCAGSDHELYLANGTIGAGTTWRNAPAGAWLDTKVAGTVYTGCGGYKPFGLDAKGNIRAGGVSTYFVKARDEGDGLAWRKLDPYQTNLAVNYNTRPNPPDAMNTDPRLADPCRWCAGRRYVGSDFIRLQGRLSDPDNDQLTAIWDIYGGPTVEHREGPTLGSGNTFSTDVDLRGRDGQYVSWTLWGRDGPDGGDWKNGPGPFMVDRVGIDRAPGVTGVLYQEDNRWHGGPGVPGSFTFDASGVADVDHYLYGWSDPPSTQVDADALGGGATVSIAPPGDGPRDLYVQSVDRAGHRSPTRKLHLYVRAGNGPLAQWSLEGNAQDTAFLGDRHGTVTGTASYVPAAVGSGLALDGVSGQVTAPNTVRTDASFSVSAWARIDRLDDQIQMVVSQDGARTCGFCLDYDGEKRRWVFMMPQADTDNPPGWDFVTSSAAPVAGQWTHLTGVYDAAEKKLRLYVNGVLAGTQTHAASWHAPGLLRIGSVRSQTIVGGYFPGTIDEVNLYDRALSDVEVRAAVSRDNVRVGAWKFDEPDGTTAANAVPGGASAVLNGGAAFVPNGAAGGAVKLSKPADFVSTGAPVLRTDQSFSVATWAWLDQAPGATDAATAVAQDGAVNSAFFLEYRNDPAGARWEFLLPSADAVPRPGDSAVRSAAGTARTGEWTHLTGVYDAPAQQIRIYVNGKLAGTAPRTAGFHASGPLLLGRAKWEGVTTNPWVGSVDELRAYNRVVSEEEIRGLVSGDNVTVGRWRLDGDAQDSSPRALHGTAINAPDFTGGQSSLPDPSDLALRLDGATTAVSIPHAVDVDRSFSVAAWARLDRLGGLPAVVSEDGARVSSFKLRVKPDGRWGFVMFHADAEDDGTGRDEVTGAAVQLGQWTHLVGVYDAGAGQLQLYVNGVLAGSVAHRQTWNSTGAFQIGRAKWGGAPVEYFPGSIDDVAVYSRALFAAEIQAMAGRDLTLVHNYPLDESSGRNAADAVGSRSATLTGGASFGPGRVGNAVALDGVDDTATTSGVDLRSDQAFTVSAWVRLPAKGCAPATVTACRRDAVTIDGVRTSKFRLGYATDPDSDNLQHGVWTFEMPESDTDDAPVTKAAVSTLPSEINSWVHLVGVYDPATKRIWLYVNGTRVGDGTLNTPWQPTGAGGLAIGRGRLAGAPAEYWRGDVDDVRLYTGQLDPDRIFALYHSYPAESAPAALPVADAGLWRFDENTGTAAADASGRGLTATLKGGAGWIGGRDAYAVELDGTSGYAETAGPVLDTGRSFSAAAWVYLNGAGTANRAVLGQDGNRLSTFLLQYNAAVKKWAVVVPTVDRDDPGSAVTILNSAEPAADGQWTHLAMSYDANLHQIRLYVNGLLSGARVGVTVLPSTGRFSIGRARWNGGNSAFFPRVVDDVRVYSRAISDGEVRKIHDDVDNDVYGFYRFDDGSARDSTWRHLDATVSGGASFGPGVSGQALQLDGATGTAAVPWVVPMLDSFTVSAWARLSRTDQVATIASQDGDRMSGYFLQYRPELRRWAFGAAESDSDAAPLVYVASLVPPKADEWTQVTGVYDYAGRQLRLYVDGELVGTRNNVVLWRATGGVVLGRGKTNGQASGFFPGALDEVRVTGGVVDDATIADRGRWGDPQPGQLGRFLNAAGDHYTGPTDRVRDGYHFEGTLGLPAAVGPNTRMLYACARGADAFTSLDAGCEGATKLDDVGLVYTTPPTNLATIPVYRCASATDRFESRLATCEGATSEGLLGYTVAYGVLARYNLAEGPDHDSTTDGPLPSYRAEGPQGLLALTPEAGTRPLFRCAAGTERFVSTDPACAGRTVLASLGRLWPEVPVGRDSRPIYQCRFRDSDSFVSLDAGCEGQPGDRQLLGYVLTAAPDVVPTFG
ncbi:LamG domain-containing protein [Micromonospora sp. NPDC049559]|uniref:LamG domain-containing protein n=1 Tax=Micromonospora sp. NPDC049559 TaxID=3155923 RepID=UPI00344655D3